MFDAPTDGNDDVGGDCDFDGQAQLVGQIPRAPWDPQSDHRSRESTAGRMGRLVSALPADRQMVLQLGGGAATRRRTATGLSLPIMCAAPVISPELGGVHHPAPILPARATTAAHEPMIIFGTYLASPAAHAHSAPRATACDAISPGPRTRWSGAISGGGAGAGLDPAHAEPTVQDTAHPQRPGDLRVPVMTCDFSRWQVLGSNQRRLSRRFYRPRTIRA